MFLFPFSITISHSPFPISRSQFSMFYFSFSIPHSPFPILHFPFPISHSPFPIPHSPFPIPHSPFLVFHYSFPLFRGIVQESSLVPGVRLLEGSVIVGLFVAAEWRMEEVRSGWKNVEFWIKLYEHINELLPNLQR